MSFQLSELFFQPLETLGPPRSVHQSTFSEGKEERQCQRQGESCRHWAQVCSRGFAAVEVKGWDKERATNIIGIIMVFVGSATGGFYFLYGFSQFLPLPGLKEGHFNVGSLHTLWGIREEGEEDHRQSCRHWFQACSCVFAAVEIWGWKQQRTTNRIIKHLFLVRTILVFLNQRQGGFIFCRVFPSSFPSQV